MIWILVLICGLYYSGRLLLRMYDLHNLSYTVLFTRLLLQFVPTYIEDIDFSRLEFFPRLILQDFSCTVKKGKGVIGMLIKWDSLQIRGRPQLIYYWFQRLWVQKSAAELENYKLVTISITGLDINVPNLRFRDFLGDESSSSYNGKDEYQKQLNFNKNKIFLLSWLNWLQSVTLIHIDGFNLDVYMYQAGQYLTISSGNIESKFEIRRNDTISLATIVTVNDFHIGSSRLIVKSRRKGDSGISLAGSRWFDILGEKCVMCMSVDMRTMLKDIEVDLHHTNKIDLQLEPFLDLYREYQHAEDSSYEIKMFTTSVKAHSTMRKMQLIMKAADVIVRDARCDVPHHLELDSFMTMFLKEEKEGDEDDDEDDDIDEVEAEDEELNRDLIFSTEEQIKIMKVKLGRVNFVQSIHKYNKYKPSRTTNSSGSGGDNITDTRLGYISNISVDKTLDINSYKANFVDIENMNVNIEEVHFPLVDEYLMRWFFVLQEVSDMLPSSRFSHLKDSNMRVDIKEIEFGLDLFLANGCDNHKHSNNISSSNNKNELMFLRVKDAVIEKLLLHHETASRFILSAHSCIFRPLFTCANLQYDFNVANDMFGLDIGYNNNDNNSDSNSSVDPGDLAQYSVKWDFNHIQVHFDLEGDLSLKKVNSETLTIHEELVPWQTGSRITTYTVLEDAILDNIICSSCILEPSPLNVTWVNDNMKAEIGKAVVVAGLGSMLRSQYSFRMILEFFTYIGDLMSSVKKESNKKTKTSNGMPEEFKELLNQSLPMNNNGNGMNDYNSIMNNSPSSIYGDSNASFASASDFSQSTASLSPTPLSNRGKMSPFTPYTTNIRSNMSDNRNERESYFQTPSGMLSTNRFNNSKTMNTDASNATLTSVASLSDSTTKGDLTPNLNEKSKKNDVSSKAPQKILLINVKEIELHLPIIDDENDNSIDGFFRNFSYRTEGLSTTYGMDSCVIFSTNYPTKCFIDITYLKFNSIRPDPTLASSVSAIATDTCTHLNLDLSAIIIRFAEAMKPHLLIQALIGQYNCLMTALRGPLCDARGVSVPGSNFIFQAAIDALALTVDAEYNGVLEDAFVGVDISELMVTLDSTASRELVLNVIHAYEIPGHDPLNSYEYQSISGGQINIEVRELACGFQPIGAAFLVADRGKISGHMYATSLKHPSVNTRTCHGLCDPLLFLAKVENSKSNQEMLANLNISVLSEGGTGHLNIYYDLLLHFTRLNLVVDKQVLECYFAGIQAIRTCLLGPDEPLEHPPLNVWDTVALSLHGSAELHFGDLEFSYALVNKSINMRMDIEMTGANTKIRGNRKEYYFYGDDLTLLGNFARDSDLHQGHSHGHYHGHVQQGDPFNHPHGKNVPQNHHHSGAWDGKATGRTQLSYMPSLEAKLQIVQITNVYESYNQHDLYIHPSLDSSDPFARFRTPRGMFACFLQVKSFLNDVAEDIREPFTIFLHVNVLAKIALFLKEGSTESNNEVNANKDPSKYISPTAARHLNFDESGNFGFDNFDNSHVDERGTPLSLTDQSHHSLSQVPTVYEFSPLDLIGRFEMLFSMQDFMVTSWLSEENRIGATAFQKSFKARLRLKRADFIDSSNDHTDLNPSSNTKSNNDTIALGEFPHLDVDYFVASGAHVDVYVRDFTVSEVIDSSSRDNSNQGSADFGWIGGTRTVSANLNQNGSGDHSETANQLNFLEQLFGTVTSDGTGGRTSTSFSNDNSTTNNNIINREPNSPLEVKGLFDPMYKIISTIAFDVQYMEQSRAERFNFQMGSRNLTDVHNHVGKDSNFEFDNAFDLNAVIDFDVDIDYDGVDWHRWQSPTPKPDIPLITNRSDQYGSSFFGPLSPRRRSTSTNSAPGVGQSTETSIEAKIWTIKIEDTQILWTISIRDSIYSFVDGIMKRDDAGIINELTGEDSAITDMNQSQWQSPPFEPYNDRYAMSTTKKASKLNDRRMTSIRKPKSIHTKNTSMMMSTAHSGRNGNKTDTTVESVTASMEHFGGVPHRDAIQSPRQLLQLFEAKRKRMKGKRSHLKNSILNSNGSSSHDNSNSAQNQLKTSEIDTDIKNISQNSTVATSTATHNNDSGSRMQAILHDNNPPLISNSSSSNNRSRDNTIATKQSQQPQQPQQLQSLPSERVASNLGASSSSHEAGSKGGKSVHHSKLRNGTSVSGSLVRNGSMYMPVTTHHKSHSIADGLGPHSSTLHEGGSVVQSRASTTAAEVGQVNRGDSDALLRPGKRRSTLTDKMKDGWKMIRQKVKKRGGSLLKKNLERDEKDRDRDVRERDTIGTDMNNANHVRKSQYSDANVEIEKQVLRLKTIRRPLLRDAPIFTKMHNKHITYHLKDRRSSYSKNKRLSNDSDAIRNSVQSNMYIDTSSLFGKRVSGSNNNNSNRISILSNNSASSGNSDHVDAESFNNELQMGTDSLMDKLVTFVVGFVNLQLQVVDEKTNSSFLIATSKASLKGLRRTNATVCVTPEMEEVPKRLNTIELEGQKVTLYTVKTQKPYTTTTSMNDDINYHRPSLSSISGDFQSQMDNFDQKTLIRWIDYNDKGSHSLDKTSSGFEIRRCQCAEEAATSTSYDTSALKRAVLDFQLGVNYNFFTDIAVGDVEGMTILPGTEDLQASFKLEVPEFHMEMDSSQFNIFTAVLRNVLLAAPPEIDMTKNINKQDKTRGKRINRIHPSGSIPPVLDMEQYASVNELKGLIERWLLQELRNIPGIARLTEVFVGRGTWLLKGSNPDESTSLVTSKLTSGSSNVYSKPKDYKDIMKVIFNGLYATHEFHSNECTSTVLEIQRFSAETPTISPEAKRAFDDPKRVISVVDDDQVCVRCGKDFFIHSNGPSACRYHMDPDGWVGQYDHSKDAWTCCGSKDPNEEGCVARPHMNREVMVSVRAEQRPSARVEHVDVMVLTTLSISMFPEANCTLLVQLTKSLVESLHEYFNIGAMNEEEYRRKQRKLLRDLKLQSSRMTPEEITALLGGSGLSMNGSNSLAINSIVGSNSSIGTGSGLEIQIPNNNSYINNNDNATSPTINPLAADTSLQAKKAEAEPDVSNGITSAQQTSVRKSIRPGHRKSRSRTMRLSSNLDSAALLAAIANEANESSEIGREDEGGPTNDPNNNNDNSTELYSINNGNNHHLLTNNNSNRVLPSRLSISSSALQSLNRGNVSTTYNRILSSTRRGFHRRGKLVVSSGDLKTIADAAIAANAEADIIASNRQEMLYIKYCRVGAMRVQVSMDGFIFPLKKTEISIDPYVRHAVVFAWKDLLWDMEKHAGGSVIKNKATTWGTRIKNWIMRSDDTNDGDDHTLPNDEVRRRELLGIG